MRAESVGVRASGRWLLRRASFALRPGELVAVIGPNGAGKSTLLRALAGERDCAEGSVTLDGVDLARWDPATLARRRAVLAQRNEAPAGWTCLDLVSLGRTPHGDADARAGREVALRCLARVDLARVAERPIAQLSGGEQQRVHLARALAQLGEGRDEGRYLLLDEPVTWLDPAHQHAVMRVAREAARAGVGVVAVLHELALAGRYADRVVMLSNGEVAAEGKARAVLDAGLLEAVWGVAFVVPEVAGAPHPVAIHEGDDEVFEPKETR